MKQFLTSVLPSSEGRYSIITRPELRWPTEFEYQFFEGPLANVAIFYEVRDNPGASITNAAEKVYAVFKHNFSPDKPLFAFETYCRLYDDDMTISAVVVSGNKATWLPFTYGEVENIIKALSYGNGNS